MLTQIIPSYLYVQYQDEPIPAPPPASTSAIAGLAIAGLAVAGYDPNFTPVSNLQAFVNAYNSIAQGYLTSVNTLSLPVYTGLSGEMLDWVALGLYGMYRPSLSAGVTFTPLGVYDTVEYNTTAYSEDVKGGDITSYVVTDDFFKRILTWNFYKGDGFQFTTSWLKRRIKRFLYGLNGVDFPMQDTYEISVVYSYPNTIDITIPDIGPSPVFAAALAQGVLNMPFQFNFTVTY